MSHTPLGMKGTIAWLLVFFVGIASSTRADDYALVVGVNECPQFRFANGLQPKPLRGAETDADDISQLLVNQYNWPSEHVQLLKGTAANRLAIATAFSELSKKLRSDDTFVFHFSGHGTQISDRKPFDEPDGLDEALCPSDATAMGDNLIVDDELGLWLENLPCRQVTVILDCCHSGTGIKDVDDDVAPRFLTMLLAKQKPQLQTQPKSPWRDLRGDAKSFDRQITAFYACHAEQQAYERRLPDMKAPARVGQFSHYFVEGLRDMKADADHNGVVNNSEAFEYAKRRLDETFNRGRQQAVERQEPILESDAANAQIFRKR